MRRLPRAAEGERSRLSRRARERSAARQMLPEAQIEELKTTGATVKEALEEIQLSRTALLVQQAFEELGLQKEKAIDEPEQAKDERKTIDPRKEFGVTDELSKSMSEKLGLADVEPGTTNLSPPSGLAPQSQGMIRSKG